MMIGHVAFILFILGATLNCEIYVVYFEGFICLEFILKIPRGKPFDAFMTCVLNFKSSVLNDYFHS